VLDNLARNTNWTASLGNAYFNQPADVMNAVQAARVQAQQAGYLRTTPQARVAYNGGLIEIVPVNPEVVYVPYYDPWRIYGGGWVTPYGGYYLGPPPFGVALGLGIGFAAVGISIGLFSHYGWGYNSWGSNWRGGVVVYNHNTYISNSRTVYNGGHFGGYNRGVFEHEGRGVPANFHPVATREGFAASGRPGFNRAPAAAARPAGGAFENRPLQHSPAAAARAQGARPAVAARPQAQAARPAPRAEAARPEARSAAPARSAPAAHAAPAAHSAPASHGGGEHGGGEHGHH